MLNIDPRKLVGPLALVSVLETLSFLALLGAMVLLEEGGTRSFIGALHGMLFLVYAAVLVLARRALDWTLGFVALGILTGPVGAIIVLERMRRAGVLTPAGAEQ
jgi:integral membrane protein